MADLKVFKVVDSNGEFRVVHALTSLDAVCKFVSDSKISELELREKINLARGLSISIQNKYGEYQLWNRNSRSTDINFIRKVTEILVNIGIPSNVIGNDIGWFVGDGKDHVYVTVPESYVSRD